MKKLVHKNEFYVTVTLIVLIAIIQIQSGQFFSANNLVDIARACILPGILTLGVMMQIIARSIDVSFPATAMVSMYVVTELATSSRYCGNVIFLFLLAGAVGTVLGLINGVFAAWLKLPTLIITLGTSSIYMGVLQGVLKCRVIAAMAQPLEDASVSYIFTATNRISGLTSPLPSVFILLLLTIGIVFYIMRYTTLGRGIFAFGGDPVAAQRAGFNTAFTQIFVFAFMGFLAGIGGLTRTVLTGTCQPTALEGYEMVCIAAAVLGGTRLSGGIGNVGGTLLGVLLMTTVSSSLILMGIPTYWSKLVTGIFIIAGTAISAYQLVRAQDKSDAVVAVVAVEAVEKK